ncbi:MULTISPECIES: SGNH/GDSL hydrolase family protein [Actinomadura]|uniref:SGNH/GDSL hydrolase family protein n=1 Tax=Actinomadura yumaensis TaxID=111807 RepID=A0ABW2CL51_9ACTN|nr:SGNH/GDSL hydrolase family protein [Actinomadura sp. J1-007]MWK36905.1 SGNH/GDSL hydrolase family protein [Actinomadura sp. J1-007]
MHITTTPLLRLPGSVHRIAGLALAAAAATLSLTACQGTGGDGKADGGPAPSGGTKQDAKPRRLLWMGDSIAEAEAPALEAAMKAGRAEFRSMAAAGGGGVTGPIAQPTWKALAKELRTFKPDVVAYQITTYDWGTPAEQRAGYERLARTVKAANAELLILPSPPFKMDDFYKPHANEIRTAPKAAVQVARRHPETVHFLNSSALWGTDRAAPKAQRSKDGIHSCQQGSAAFAKWFGDRQHELYSFAPAPPERWATGPWTGSKVYSRLGCK